MYKRKLRGWAKHLDFLIADLICLQLAIFLAYYMRHGILDIYTSIIVCQYCDSHDTIRYVNYYIL